MALQSTDIPTTTRPTRGSERASARAAVTAVGVTVRRRQRVVLHDVDVSVARGELVAIAGASGAGKTTLLRVLAALEHPAAGRVDHAETGPSGTGVSIGFVPQDDIVHRELPVRSTLRYAAALRLPARAGTDEREAAVAELLDELGLAERAGVRVGALSGGQRKRVSIAVELLRRPSLLLLDEPTSGLDPATAAGVMSLLARIARRGVAVVVTTHREADLEQCDRVVFLGRTGRIAADGPLAAVLIATGASRISDIYERVAASGAPALDEKPPAPVPAAVPGPARRLPAICARGPAGGARALAERRPARARAAVRAPARARGPAGRRRCAPEARPIGAMRRALVLPRRNAEVMARNPLTLAVLL